MLSEKQKEFCNQYLIDLNATQAAIRAGYSEKTSGAIGSENLTKLEIQEYIQQKRKKLSDKLEISQDRILKEYARVAFSDLRAYYDQNGRLIMPKDLDDDAAAALAGIEVFEEFGFDADGNKTHIGDTKKIKTYNKLNALDSLAKHLGMFEKDNSQRKPEITPFTDNQVDKILETIRENKNH